MGADFQLVEQGFVIQAVGGEAMQINHPLRREPNFIGEAREVILPLAVVIAHRINRLTAVAELAQCLTDILH